MLSLRIPPSWLCSTAVSLQRYILYYIRQDRNWMCCLVVFESESLCSTVPLACLFQIALRNYGILSPFPVALLFCLGWNCQVAAPFLGDDGIIWHACKSADCSCQPKQRLYSLRLTTHRATAEGDRDGPNKTTTCSPVASESESRVLGLVAGTVKELAL